VKWEFKEKSPLGGWGLRWGKRAQRSKEGWERKS